MDIKEKQKLEEEKMNLTGIYNALQEKIDSYNIPDIAMDSGMFKELANKKYAIEMRIKQIKKLLDE